MALRSICRAVLLGISSSRWRPPTISSRAVRSSARWVIGAETFSRILDWNDRGNLRPCSATERAQWYSMRSPQAGTSKDRGILTTHLRSDGRHKDKLFVDGGPSTTQTVGHLRMEGREVFKHAVGMITDVIVDAFAATGTTADDLDWLVPHQANKRIIDASAKKLHIAPQKVVLTVDIPRKHVGGNRFPLAPCGGGRRRDASRRTIL